MSDVRLLSKNVKFQLRCDVARFRKGFCSTDNRTWGDIFECCFKAHSSKLERLFCHVPVERDVRALRFELWKSFRKCPPKWGWLYFQKYDDLPGTWYKCDDFAHRHFIFQGSAWNKPGFGNLAMSWVPGWSKEIPPPGGVSYLVCQLRHNVKLA